MDEFTREVQVVVIGGGPGGYAAAFRAADLGMDVAMIDMAPRPGGVCLFQGCIPSKTLLHLTEVMHDAHRAADMGVSFGQPQVDLAALRAWKSRVIARLAGGLVHLSKGRGVQLVQARAVFEGSDTVRLHGPGVSRFKFRHAILATGSQPIPLPGTEFSEGGRVMSSAGALELADVPETLLVVGGGYVGLELGMVYASLGSRVTLVELTDRLAPGADRDLAKPLVTRVLGAFEAVYLNTRVASLQEYEDGVAVVLEGAVEPSQQRFDRVLVAIGRRPNSRDIGLETTGVEVNHRGFAVVDRHQRTAAPHIFAVGDVVGGAMLAHKAMREGKVAAEVIAGEPSAFDARAIPAVIYTDPQLAWCGLTEEQARQQNRPIEVARFPWRASGRAATLGIHEGLTKVIFDPDTEQALGVGIVGRGAGEMIAEGVLAVEMGALARDMALAMHPHPTLSETEGEAAEAFLGHATHILPRRRSPDIPFAKGKRNE
ncbi:MAG: dihydrolipoyl dehydrogenase [Anaerolineae bacterium]|nr:MAG: dihydrolipoyl dehydrogenase [Anaerolineae bacterium]